MLARCLSIDLSTATPTLPVCPGCLKVRRMEDKMDFKGLANHTVVLRMDAPANGKKVPLVFQAWVVLDEQSEDQNIFKTCQLLADRTGLPKLQNLAGLRQSRLLFHHCSTWFQWNIKLPVVTGISMKLMKQFRNFHMSSFGSYGRAPRALIPFLPESKYVVPTDLESLPHTAEGSRQGTHIFHRSSLSQYMN